ncbi:methyl-accepting chemotaxis protein [Vibrio vulnificus]|uniref:methyl-accepting chemotaxis protein n=1 Tax=Vibrio vulnificus TaxID=672 RepID=UPI00215CBF0A|nr:methyl-accepting chemotaxis protein [Vibrio vulnificus]MCR9500680.1 methyl-accepting chemotaxis protein [Vibrio vulnificus]
MNIKNRFHLILLIIVISFLASFALLYQSLEKAKENKDYLLEQIIGSYRSISNIENLLNEKRRYELLAINSINKNTNLSMAEKVTNSLELEFEMYEKYDANDEDIKTFGLLKNQISEYNEEIEKLLNHYTEEGYEHSLASFRAIFKNSTRLKEINEIYIIDFNKKFEEDIYYFELVATIMYCLILIFLLFLMIQTIRSIISRLNIINNSVREFINLNIAEGELCSFINSNKFKKDEIGILMNLLKDFRIEICGMIELTKDTCNATSRKLQSFNEQVDNNAKSMQVAQDNMNQLVTAINEISVTAEETSNNISIASELTSHSLTTSEITQSFVEKTSNDILNTNNKLEASNQVVQQLQDDSERISSVLEMISTIADQTNLLALNAAIEAARAGEQGRGFAVVADEVRMLAQKTQESTSNIEEIITQLQNRANSVKAEVNSCFELMESCIDSSAESLKNMEEVSSNISKLNEMEVQVATAAEEQTCVINEINVNAVNISDITSLSYDVSNDLTIQITDINKEVSQLNEILLKFKTVR